MADLNPNPKVLCSASELAAQLSAPDLLIIDCRFQLQDPDWGARQYQQGHLPGAIYLSLDRDLAAPPSASGGRHPLPDATTLVKTLAHWGFRYRQSRVVVYDTALPAIAARLWWQLRYWGHEAVTVLDGGWQAWQAAGYPTTTALPTPNPVAECDPMPQSAWLVDRAEVKQAIAAGQVVLDCRDRDRYAGRHEPLDPIAGQIPGAVNLPWRELCYPDGRLHTPADLHRQWQTWPITSESIVYCGSGVTACVNLLSLVVAGLPQARLYPGGWSAWCRTEPVQP